MTPDYLLLCNILLLTRLYYLRNDTSLSWQENLWLAAVQLFLVLLVFQLSGAVYVACMAVMVVTVLNGILEPRLDLRNGYRLVSLFLLLIIPGFFAESWGLGVRPFWSGVVEAVPQRIPLLAAVPLEKGSFFLLVFFGLLLLTNEINILIRAVFHHCGLEPQSRLVGKESTTERHGEIDQQEYNAGRVIGFLERWLMYLLVIYSGDMAALAFIIAAKGLARMKQLEDKVFAEYMLIGTLLSAFSAVVVGLWVRSQF